MAYFTLAARPAEFTQEHWDTLLYLSKAKVALWNLCMEADDAHLRETGQRLSKYDLRDRVRHTPEYKRLPNHTAEAVVFEYKEARKSHRENAGQKHRRPPGKKDERRLQTLTFLYTAFKVENDTLRLSLGNLAVKELGLRYLRFRVRENLSVLRIKEIALVPHHGRWRIHVTYEATVIPGTPQGTALAGCDYGMMNLSTTVNAETGEVRKYPGENALAVHNHYVQAVSAIDQLMSRCKRGSKRHKRLARIRRRMFHRKRAQMRAELDRQAKRTAENLLSENVALLVAGDLRHIKQGKKRGTRYAGWIPNRHRGRLKHHLHIGGCGYKEENEAWTSRTCHVCGRRMQRPRRETVVCPVHGAMDADANGAANILALHLGTFRLPTWTLTRSLPCEGARETVAHGTALSRAVAG